MDPDRVFKISSLSRRTGVNKETIRYYERIGLLRSPARSSAGHRIYNTEDFKRLSLIRRCRKLGFSVREIRSLLGLISNRTYTCGEIRSRTLEHLEDVRSKKTELEDVERALIALADQCEESHSKECPIVDALYGP